MKKKIKLLQRFLRDNNIESIMLDVLPDYDGYYCLEWKNQESKTCRVYEGDVLVTAENELIAFQEEQDECEYYLKVIKDGEIVFTYEFERPDDDINKWGNIYIEKHHDGIINIVDQGGYITIVSCREGETKTYTYAGELIGRNRDIISIERYEKVDKKNPIELFLIPELEYIGSISREKAEKIDLTPCDTNKPKGMLLKEIP